MEGKKEKRWGGKALKYVLTDVRCNIIIKVENKEERNKIKKPQKEFLKAQWNKREII
jgi:D-alanyl-lipoteichoic acid acyltransferase DltB (MBOAT superfamily)